MSAQPGPLSVACALIWVHEYLFLIRVRPSGRSEAACRTLAQEIMCARQALGSRRTLAHLGGLLPVGDLPQSLCSFFGFYDANETVLEMEEQPVSPWGFPAFTLPRAPQIPAPALSHSHSLHPEGRWSTSCLWALTGSPPVLLPLQLSHPQKVYLRDSFGLKTLLARGAIKSCPMSGIAHTAWHSNRTLYETCIEPWLS